VPFAGNLRGPAAMRKTRDSRRNVDLAAELGGASADPTRRRAAAPREL
jgi:hypothetical protein